jgi:hypothetical protein
MTNPYLLDTSAFRALPCDTLERLAAERSLLVSPFCFWELVSHLDEPDQFSRVKGNLMKFRHAQVLDDPEAISIVELGTEPLLAGRVSDDCLIYSSLAALQESDSLISFYSKRIRDSQGKVRELSECVARTKDLLRVQEERFQDFVYQIVASVKAGASTLETPWDLHRATVSLTNGWHIAQCGQPLNENVHALRILYVYFAFVVFCARDCLEYSRVKVNLNDYEDARLCQHVRLDIPCTIISADKRQRDRLKEIFSLLETVAVPQLKHSYQVLTEKDLS